MEQSIEEQFKVYSSLCWEDAKYTESFAQRENYNSERLTKIFENRNIFKEFLKSVITSNIYSAVNTGKEYKIDFETVNNLDFGNNYKPKTQVYTTNNRPIDIYIEGENFICIIEHKQGSVVQNQQCRDYRNYII